MNSKFKPFQFVSIDKENIALNETPQFYSQKQTAFFDREEAFAQISKKKIDFTDDCQPESLPLKFDSKGELKTKFGTPKQIQ